MGDLNKSQWDSYMMAYYSWSLQRNCTEKYSKEVKTQPLSK